MKQGRNVAETSRIEAVKNQVRGNVARYRSRAFNPDDVTATSSFRTSIRQSLLTARIKLKPGEHVEFLEWFKNILKQELGSEYDVGFGFDYLNGVITSKHAELRKEISWIAARIHAEASQLNDFRAHAELVENRILKDDVDGALQAMSAISSQFGETMWGIQLCMALHHRLGGLESQKSYLEEVRSQHRRGILSYIAFHTSVRNEERTSWIRFQENIVIGSKRRRDKALSRYIDYRLLSHWPTTESGMADILRLEQSCSVYDVYETFVRFAQNVAVNHPEGELFERVKEALRSISAITDYRISKILNTGGSDELSPARRHIAKGNYRKAYRELLQFTDSRTSTWSMIYTSALRAIRVNRSTVSNNNALQDALDEAFSGGRFDFESFDHLAKTCLNFEGISAGKSLREALNCIYPMEGRPSLCFKASGLNSRMQMKEDTFGVQPVYEEIALYQPVYAAASEALKCYAEKDYHGVGEVLAGVEFPDPVTQSLMAIIHVHSLDASGDLKALIQLISHVGCENLSTISLSSLSQIATGYQPISFKKLPAEIPTLNALNMLWKASDIDHIGSTLKMLTGKFLRSTNVGAPSNIDLASAGCSESELIYFLHEVCVPSVLDVSRVFKSSKAVSEERQKICGLLHELDSDRAEEYSAEVSAITRRLKVDEGLQIVDQSRVHVDTDALIRWAAKNISEDYGRYSDLIDAGIGTSGSYDDTLKELRDIRAKSLTGELVTPENEADNILASILMKLRDEFLNSSTFGLDYFLSQRIRHVSFIGLLRGPLEFLSLISNRATAQSEYSSNRAQLDQFTELPKKDVDHLDTAFKRFSADFDASISKVKNVSLQIRTTEKTSGLFYIPVSTTVLMLARALYGEARSMADFVDSASVIFWAVLNEPLKKVRHRIEVGLREELAIHFGQLRDSLRIYEQKSPEVSRTLEHLALAERQVNEALREASSWFTRPELREVSKTFTLEETLDVAIESAQKLHANFAPKIMSRVSEDVNLRGPDLVFITDAILVAFSNIKAYSKMSEPEVNIDISVSREDETISVEVINECSANARAASQDKKMDAIRDAILNRDFGKKPRTEGGSGFLKLAAVAYQSDKGNVNFGFVDKTHFMMNVTYSFIFDAKNLAI